MTEFENKTDKKTQNKMVNKTKRKVYRGIGKDNKFYFEIDGIEIPSKFIIDPSFMNPYLSPSQEFRDTLGYIVSSLDDPVFLKSLKTGRNFKTNASFGKANILTLGINIYCSIKEGEDAFQAVVTSSAEQIGSTVITILFKIGVGALSPEAYIIKMVVETIAMNFLNSALDYWFAVKEYNSRIEYSNRINNVSDSLINEKEEKIKIVKKHNFPNEEKNLFKLESELLELKFHKKKNISLKNSDFENQLIIDSLEGEIKDLNTKISEINKNKLDYRDYNKLKLLQLELSHTLSYKKFLKETIYIKLLRYKYFSNKDESELRGIINNLNTNKYFLNISLREAQKREEKKREEKKREEKNRKESFFQYDIQEYTRVIEAIDIAIRGNLTKDDKILVITPYTEKKFTVLLSPYLKDTIRLLDHYLEIKDKLKYDIEIGLAKKRIVEGIIKGEIEYPVKEESLLDFIERNIDKDYIPKNYKNYDEFVKLISNRSISVVRKLSRLHFPKIDNFVSLEEIKKMKEDNVGKEIIENKISYYQARVMVERGQFLFDPFTKSINDFINEIINKDRENKKDHSYKSLVDYFYEENKVQKEKSVDFEYMFLTVLEYKNKNNKEWGSERELRENPDKIREYFTQIQDEKRKFKEVEEKRKDIKIKIDEIYTFFFERGIKLNYRNLTNNYKYYQKYKNEKIQIEKEELNNSLSEKKVSFRRKHYPDNKFNLRKEKDKLISEQQKYEEELKNTIDKDEIEELKTKINQISEVLYSDKVSEDNPYGSRYKVYKEREKQSDDKAVMKSLIRNDKEYNPEEHKSFREYIEDKFKSLDSADYKKLLEEGNEFENKVNKVLKYIWNNPEIDSSLFTESYLYNNPELVDLYYKQMEVENKSKDMDEKIIVYDTKAVLEEIESMKNIFENHKKNIAIHNYEFNISNIVSRLTQLFA